MLHKSALARRLVTHLIAIHPDKLLQGSQAFQVSQPGVRHLLASGTRHYKTISQPRLH